MVSLAAETHVERLLKDKSAVIYGACGAIGGAVARAIAREGAKVFLMLALDPFVGRFKTTSRMWMKPGEAPPGRMKVERGPAALDRFKKIVFQTIFSKPYQRSRK